MAADELTVFVDTNCFLHLRDLKDLPWRKLFPGVSRICIAIAPVIVDELDRHKEDPSNRRRRDRARLALRDIDTASEATEVGMELRASDPSVRLIVPHGSPVDWTAFPSLDPARADDQLVAAAASFPDPQTALLSVDSGPRIKARRLKITAPTPPQDWRLPEQPDDPSRELAKVSEALHRLQATKPSLTVDVLDLTDEGERRQTVSVLPALSHATRRRLDAAVAARFPTQDVQATTNLPFATSGFMSGEISPSDIAVYRADHRAFLAAQAEDLKTLHVRASWAQMFVPIVVVLENTSAVTAQRLHLRLTAVGGGEIISDWDDLVERGGALGEPEPPAAPSGYPAMFDAAKLGGGAFWNRDPTEFFELDGPDGHLRECAEFRAGRRLTLQAWWVPPAEPCDVVVHLVVSASNLPDPITRTIPVSLERGDLTWTDPAVLERLPDWMAEIIREEA